MDNVFRGKIAAQWHQDIGPYGDVARVALLNHIIARVLNQVASTPVEERTSGPNAHILSALEEIDDPERLGAQRSREYLLQWHADTSALRQAYPALDGAHLWDLGCGNAYLGAWLSNSGVNYLGVEPSPDLVEICRSDNRLQKASVEAANLFDFCAGLAADATQAPTMISIVSVLEHIRDPDSSLQALAQMLYARQWHDVPILIATLDPDFMMPGHLTQAVTAPASMPYGDPDLVSLRDPAHWEEMFARTGLSVLEQRPIHLDLLPEWLASELRAEYDTLHAQAASRTAVRQGPFYLWMVSLTRGVLVNDAPDDVKSGDSGDAGMRRIRFAEGEPIALFGNLGAGTHRVEEGLVSFKSRLLGLEMEFGPGEYFGQLELSGNYVSSRVLGTIRAAKDVSVRSAANADIKTGSAQSLRLTDELFLSLLLHLDAIRFSALVTPQRTTTEHSQVLGTAIPHNWVRNYAGALLQRCSDAVAAQEVGDIRSKLVVELGPDELAKIIHGREMRAQDSHGVIPSLVQAGVIDCFSAMLFEDAGIHEDVDDARDAEANLLHIGWLAARYLLAVQPSPRDNADADAYVDHVREIAIAISAMLGCEADKEAFRETMALYVASERHDLTVEGSRQPVRSPKKGPGQIRSYICEQLLASSDPRIPCFLNNLSRIFNFNARDNYETTHYLSDLVVVRDIWALLACVADEPTLWSFRRPKAKPKQYVQSRSRRDRIIGYLQDSISFIGARAGLSVAPW